MNFRRGHRRGELSADDAGYVATAHQPLDADAASFPNAVAVLQRMPEPVLLYDRRTLYSDVAAGVRDRRVARALMSAESSGPDHGRQRLHTHHVQTLQDCSNHQAERERLAACALIAAVDHELAAAYRARVQRTEELARLRIEADGVADAEVSDEVRSLAESGEQSTHRLGRRRREHAAAVRAATARVETARAELERLERRIDALHTARTAHWSALLVRVTHLRDYYNRRANTYLRALVRGLRRAHDPVPPIAIETPHWAVPEGIAPPPASPGESVPETTNHQFTATEGPIS